MVKNDKIAEYCPQRFVCGNGVCEVSLGENSTNCPNDCKQQDCSLNNQTCFSAADCCSYYAVDNLCYYGAVCNLSGSGKCSFVSKVCNAGEVCTAQGCKSQTPPSSCNNNGVCESYFGENLNNCPNDCNNIRIIIPGAIFIENQSLHQ
jgi:hypothetical protein